MIKYLQKSYYSIMKTVIQNTHRFAKDIRLETIDNILIWYIDNKVVDIPNLSDTEYVNFIERVFDFVGTSFDKFDNKVYISSNVFIDGKDSWNRCELIGETLKDDSDEQEVDYQEVDYQEIDALNIYPYFKKIYAMKLDRKIKITQLKSCLCNMGTCSKIIDKVDYEQSFNNFGDVFAVFCKPCKPINLCTGKEEDWLLAPVYDCPDSVYVVVKHELDSYTVYKSCESEEFTTYNADSNHVHITVNYNRG